MANCSNGERVSQATIDRKRSETYRQMYAGEAAPMCWGCGVERAQGSGHLIPQKVAKDNGMAELCWLEENIVPCCHSCNSLLESYKSEEVKSLQCYELLLKITKKYLPSRYNAMI